MSVVRSRPWPPFPDPFRSGVTLAHARVDAVGGGETRAADELFGVSVLGRDDAGQHLVTVQGEVHESRPVIHTGTGMQAQVHASARLPVVIDD